MKKKRLVILVILLLGGLAGTAYWQFRVSEEQNSPLVLYGNVEIRDAQLAFIEQELVTDVLVEEGDAVKRGQPLAQLRAQRLGDQLAEARAQQEAQSQMLRRLENGSRQQEIEQARAEVKVVQSRLDNARRSLQRLEETARVGGSSAQARDDASATLAIAQAQLQVSRKTLELLIEGPREEDIEQARAQLQAASARVALFQKRLADTTLSAPFEGIIQSRIVEPGEMAGPSRPAFILVRTDPKWVRAYVPEPSLGLVRGGMQVRVFSDTWPEKAFSGQIGFISPVAEFTPKTVATTDLRTKLVYEVRVQITDPDDQLRLGMPVTVRLADESSKS